MSDNKDDSHLDPAPHHGRGRQQGRPNYNNNIIIPIVEDILPNGAEGWHLVAIANADKSGEDVLHSEDNLRRNLVCKLCNNMKKPTGRSGTDPNDRVNRCIEI